MKTLYLDCGMGAAGDMLTAALLELLPNPDAFVEELNRLHIPGVVYARETAAKCGILGTHMTVTVDGQEESEALLRHHHHHDHEHCHEHDHEHEHCHDHEHHHEHEHDHDHEHEHHHHHTGMHEIGHIVEELSVSPKVREDILAVYGLIAEAESHAHGLPVPEIHFHEVGTMDAIADVTAVCLLMDRLAPDQVIVSPVHVGAGHVHCAHGILPVPAPATAFILRDVPIYGGSVQGELCTPTGAALLKHFATRFGDLPVMTTQAIGYGMGKKDFETANCVRALLGTTAASGDEVLELSCNIDDMTAEALAFAMDQLLTGGALDVYTSPIGMKKSRPGTLLQVLCRPQDREAMVALLFRHTTTIGVREAAFRRYTLDRTLEQVFTPYGPVTKKISTGYGVRREKYEYEDLSRIAKEQGLPLDQVRSKLP